MESYPSAGHVKCGDENGSYRECYLYGNCAEVLDKESYSCYIKGKGNCDLHEKYDKQSRHTFLPSEKEFYHWVEC